MPRVSRVGEAKLLVSPMSVKNRNCQHQHESSICSAAGADLPLRPFGEKGPGTTEMRGGGNINTTWAPVKDKSASTSGYRLLFDERAFDFDGHDLEFDEVLHCLAVW
jgi:hypothetical protein